MRLPLAVCGAACLWLAACASQPSGPAPAVSVVVLPKPPKGQVGAVVVRPLRGGKPVVVDKAYVQASVDQGLGLINIVLSGALPPDVQVNFISWLAQAYPGLPVLGRDDTTIGKFQFSLERDETSATLTVQPVE